MAKELDHVSKARQNHGLPPGETFYGGEKAFRAGGFAALVEKRRGPKNSHPNQIPETVEKRILDLYLEKPTYGTDRIANELRLQSVEVSPSGLRDGWLHNDLETRYKSLLRPGADARPSPTSKSGC